MIKTTVSVNGMACSICEVHINDAIRAVFPVRKVTSSHTKKETVILRLRLQAQNFIMKRLRSFLERS